MTVAQAGELAVEAWPRGRALVSSVVRNAEPGVTSGFLHLVDLDRRRAVRRVDVPGSLHRERDPNPRGGVRGVRGVAIWEDRLLVANAERVLLYDARWRPVGELTHPLAGGIHDILPEAEGVWIASTSADLLVKLGWDGGLKDLWEWRRNARLRRELGFSHLPTVDRDRDYRDPDSMRWGVPNVAHLNGLAHSEGGLLVSFGRVLSPATLRRKRLAGAVGRLAALLGLEARRPRRAGAIPAGRVPGSSSAVVELAPGGEARVLCRNFGIDVPAHNVWALEREVVTLDSQGSRLVARHRDRPGRERAVVIPGNPGFVRGLVHAGGERFLVGNQAPLTLYLADLGTGRVLGAIPLGGVAHESTYGVCLLPDRFNDPPEAL